MARQRPTIDRQRPLPLSAETMGAKCGICPLKGASSPVFGDGPHNAKLAIVCETPNKEEAAFGLPFIGRTGEYITSMLNHYGLSRNEVLLENAVACFPPGGDLKVYMAAAKKAATAALKEQGLKGRDAKVVLPSPIDCCMPRLMRSLGVPQCKRCGFWQLRSGHPKKCACVTPSWVHVKDRQPVKAVLACGTGPTLALEGFGKVQAKQMYVFGDE